MTVKVIYDNNKDKELIELIKFATPFFIEYIDTKTIKGRKEGFKIKSEFGAKLDPFIVVYDDEDNFLKCYWSERSNACQSFINDYNDSKN